MRTIREVIEALEKAHADAPVQFAFAYAVPTTVDSWRGIYAEPALGWRDGGRGSSTDGPTASTLLAELRAVPSRTYSGWKGGEYCYRRSDPLHIDNPGECSNTEIARVEVQPPTTLDDGEVLVGRVIIHTEHDEDGL